MTTDNKIIKEGVEELSPIICLQNTAEKKHPTEEDFRLSNKNGFNDKIGEYTNRATTMEQLKSKFDKNSLEFEELEKRVRLCMHFQQCAIDKIKGVDAPSMPNEWYVYSKNKIGEKDDLDTIIYKNFMISILSNKKPKFMIYIYPDLMREYKKFIKTAKDNCLIKFKMTLEDMMESNVKSEDQTLFLEQFDKMNPVEDCNSLMNKICKLFENEFDDITSYFTKDSFNYNILKTDEKVSQSRKGAIVKIYKGYKEEVKKFKQNNVRSGSKIDSRESYEKFRNKFIKDCYKKCNNSNELINILLEICYKSDVSKQFVWDICGNEIINNLLKMNNNKINYPELSEKDKCDFYYSNYPFKMQEVTIKEEI